MPATGAARVARAAAAGDDAAGRAVVLGRAAAPVERRARALVEELRDGQVVVEVHRVPEDRAALRVPEVAEEVGPEVVRARVDGRLEAALVELVLQGKQRRAGGHVLVPALEGAPRVVGGLELLVQRDLDAPLGARAVRRDALEVRRLAARVLARVVVAAAGPLGAHLRPGRQAGQARRRLPGAGEERVVVVVVARAEAHAEVEGQARRAGVVRAPEAAEPEAQHVDEGRRLLLERVGIARQLVQRVVGRHRAAPDWGMIRTPHGAGTIGARLHVGCAFAHPPKH